MTPRAPGSARREARTGRRHKADARAALHRKAAANTLKAVSAATPPATTRCPPAERQQGRGTGREPAGAEAAPGATHVRTRRSEAKRGISPRGLTRQQRPRYRAEPSDPHLPPAGTGPGAGRGCGHRLSPPRPQPRTIARRPDRGVANRGPALIHPPPAAVGRGGLLAGPAPRVHSGPPPAARQGGCVLTALLPAPSCARRSSQRGAPPGPSDARFPPPERPGLGTPPSSASSRRHSLREGGEGAGRREGGLGRGRRGAGARPHKVLRAGPGPSVC